VGQWIPMDIPTYPTWYSGIGRTVGIWWARVERWIPMDSPTCPTWYSGIGWTVEYGRTGDTHGLYHLSHGTVGFPTVYNGF